MLLQLRINILEGFADKNMSCLSKLLPKSTDFSGGFLSSRCFILAPVNHSPFSGSYSDPECLLSCSGTEKKCVTVKFTGNHETVLSALKGYCCINS